MSSENADRDDKLVAEMKKEFPKYNGWEFDYMYPGFFSYYKVNNRVFFTPDFNDEGVIDQQIQDSYGVPIEGKQFPAEQQADVKRLETVSGGVKYKNPLTAQQLFDAAKPMMDMIDEIVGRFPNFNELLDWEKEDIKKAEERDKARG